jgi:hypothetical protein
MTSTTIATPTMRPRYIPGWDLPTDGDFNQLAHAYAWSTNALQEFEVQNRAIRARADLSAVGISTTLQTAARVFLSTLAEKREQIVDRARISLANDRRSMETAAHKSEGDVATALRASEIRTWYRGLEAEGRLAALRVALEGDDRELLRAILAAPRAFDLLPSQMRERVESVLSERTSPGEFERTKRVERAIDLATNAIDVTEQHIRSEAGLGSTFEERVRSSQPAAKVPGDGLGTAFGPSGVTLS